MDDAKREEIRNFIKAAISSELIQARQSANLTLEMAASLIGCDSGTLRKYESGVIQPLIFLKIMKVYGVSDISAYEKLNDISFEVSKIR